MKPIALLAVLFTFLILPQNVSAVTVTISNIPSEVTDQSFNFDVSVQGASAGTNYLRANFYPTNTTNYFGYTYNGNLFFNGSDYSQYLPIVIDSSGNWSGQIQAKLDANSSYYSGNGTYSLKVRRYTQSGSTYTWSNEASIIANLSSPTPSPTSQPSLTPTPTPSPSNSSLFSVTIDKSSVNSSDTLSVNVQITGLDPNTNYFLKGAFIKSGSSNYFGLTKVSSDWVKNSAPFSDQFPFTTDSSGNWNGQIQVIPDSEDSGFSGSGDYNFKVGRYPPSGSGPTWSNETHINILNVANSGSAVKSTPKPSASAQTTSPPSSISKISSSPKIDYSIPNIAGVSTQSSEPAFAESDKQIINKKGGLNFWLLGAGFLVLSAGVGVLFYLKLQQKGIINSWFSIQNLLQKLKVLPKN